MSWHGKWCSTPDGRWDVYVDVEHCLGETTTRIYINNATQKRPRRVMNDRLLLYDVEPRDVYFSRDENWLFTIDHGEKVVYHLLTGSKCINSGNHWMVAPEKDDHTTGSLGEAVLWPADQTEIWCLEDLLQTNSSDK